MKEFSIILNNKFNINLATSLIIERLIKSGATVYLVGGFVRDTLLNRDSIDIDLEVYHLSLEQIIELFKDEQLVVNEKFKTVKINDIEIALPRQELKVGLSYLDYQLYFDDDITPAQACQRRDFTINALMYNCNEKRLEDYNNGIQDLKSGVLKALNSATFCDDSIRVLRLLDFEMRLDFKVESNTKIMAQTMSQDLWHQPTMYTAQLFNRIITSPNFKLDSFIFVLNDFFLLEDTKQRVSSSIHHPEKTLFKHIYGTIMSLQLYKLKNKHDFSILFWALFFHDYGKLSEDTDHALNSIKYFSQYEELIVSKIKDRQLIKELISDHMLIREYVEANDLIKMKELKLKYRNQFYLLEIVGTCDYAGRVIDFNQSELIKRMEWFKHNIISYYRGV